MRHTKLTITIGLLLLFCLCPLSVLAKSMTAKVVLFPLDVTGAGKYSVLKDALGNMVASRLAADPGITMMENSLSVEQQKQFVAEFPRKSEKIFASLDADHIGAGAVVAIGQQIFLQMAFYVENSTAPILIEVEAEGEEQILGAVDLLLERVDEKVFGQKKEKTDAFLPLADRGGVEAFQTEHPDRKYKEEIISGAGVFTGAEGTNIAKNTILRRTSSLPYGIISLTVEDGDGDGSKEIFVASENGIRVYKYEGGLLREESRYKLRPAMSVHAMNMADIDGDGKQEIYLSATANRSFSSSILNWSVMSGFTEIKSNIRWAIRPLEIPGVGMVVAGQRLGATQETFLEPGLYSLSLDGDKVDEIERLSLPATFNLFDFVFADLDGDGYKEKVAVTSSLDLAVYGADNSLLWVSDGKKDYGGSLTYLGSRWRVKDGQPEGYFTIDDENYYDLQYIPSRLIADDVNGDGKDDIITASNILSTYKVFSNLRSFKGGNIVCLGWNEGAMAMSELWQTDVLDGYIADVDFNSSGEGLDGFMKEGEVVDGNSVQLVVGQVPSTGFTDVFLSTSEKAKLVVYQFNIVEELSGSDSAK